MLFGIISWDNFLGLLISGVLFKILIAALDTPILYVIIYGFRTYFGLKKGEEIHEKITLEKEVQSIVNSARVFHSNDIVTQHSNGWKPLVGSIFLC